MNSKNTWVSLNDCLKNPLKLEDFFKLALPLVRALAEFHRKSLVYKDLRPLNIFYNSDFTLARLQNLEADQVKGSYAYTSPEQTGRLNWPVDRRSDLYSLGIIFYEMLSGETPFTAHNPVEWVYSHIARAPDIKKLSRYQVPESLQLIIEKLLAKVADDRYQTDDGLLFDLEYCSQEWIKDKHIPLFTLGKKDQPDRLLIPQKLYGREEEVLFLYEAFNRVLKNKKQELVLVSGFSGIGKSSLVGELQRPVLHESGFFITGKFDQYKQNIPFYTFVQAFDKLVLNLLTLSDSEIAAWKLRLNTALGESGQLIVDVIPRIEVLIGPQAAVPELPPSEALNRFRAAFFRFISAIIDGGKPLALFLDDLQWADKASLGLIKDLITTKDLGPLLLIGAYREDEVDPDHPFESLDSELQKSGAPVAHLVLAPLQIQKINVLIADTLKSTEEVVQPLTDLIYKYSQGNPFFTIQLLKILFEEGTLYFDYKNFNWQWDLEKIRAKKLDDNILQLVIGKIKKLPTTVQDLLKRMACLGNSVVKKDLQKIFEYPEEFVSSSLSVAQAFGVVSVDGDQCRFMHDQLREAAYSLNTDEGKDALHFHISQFMLNHYSAEDIELRIFEIVEHLNRSTRLLTSDALKERGAKLNLIAAQKAKTTTAFKAAAEYCSFGLSLLNNHGAALTEGLKFNLSLLQAQCEMAEGNIELVENLWPSLLENSHSKFEKARAQQVLINIQVAKGQSEESLKTAFSLLKAYDIELSIHPLPAEVDRNEKQVLDELQRHGFQLNHLSRRAEKDKDLEIIMSILTEILPSAYFMNVHMHRLVASIMVDLTLRYGIFEMSAMGLAAFAFELCREKRYVDAEKLGRSCKYLVETYQLQQTRTKVFHLLGGGVFPWTNSFADSMALIEEGLRADNGDVIFKSLSLQIKSCYLAEAGCHLDQVSVVADQALSYAKSHGVQVIRDAVIPLNYFIRKLKGQSIPQEMNELILTHSSGQVVAWGSYFRLCAHVFLGEYEKALTEADVFTKFKFNLRGQTVELELVFLKCMAIAGCYEGVDLTQQEQWLKELKAGEQDLNSWAKVNPANFRSRWIIIAAEIARIEKRDLAAQALFEEAIQLAIQGEQHHIKALAYERAANFYNQRKFNLIGETYLKKSYEAYLDWGATAKAAQLAVYAGVPAPVAVNPAKALLNYDLGVSPEQIDLISAINASQIISEAIELDELVLTLLKVILEQSGADKGILVLCKDEVLTLEAIATNRGSGFITELVQSESIEASVKVPKSILRYVQRLKETVIISDISKETAQFSTDPYFVKTNPKSILALPIIRGNQLLGILYLENRITSGVFSAQRLFVLNLVASQVAISLQNAIYYRAIRASQAQLQSIIDSTTASIVIRDLQGRYILVNKRFEERANLSEKEVLGKTDYDLFSKEQADRIRMQELKVLETAAPLEKEEEFSIGGQTHTFLIAKFPLYSDGHKINAICTIATDITARILVEKEREALLEATQKSVRVRDDFISIVSHELRTPLTPLKMSLDMLRMTLERVDKSVLPKFDVLANAFDRSEKLVDRLAKLTEDILDVSVVTAGRLKLNPEYFDLVPMLNDVIESFRDSSRQSGCELRINISSEPIGGHWDLQRIRQAVSNIIHNAIKYGCGKPIEIKLVRQEGWAVFTVTDQGVGIALEEQERIFEHFERAVSVNNYGGLGLGLYLARAIVTAHGGTVAVKSQLNMGSTFTIRLPVS